MTFKVKPILKLVGKIRLPASKSYSIRAFIIAACGGNSKITAPSNCDDALVAMRIAKNLGSAITQKNNIFQVKAFSIQPKLSLINVQESGTVLRFLLPLISIYGQKAKITGEGTLFGRPNQHLLKTLRSQGVDIRGQGPKESIPIYLNGGILKPGKIEIDGSLSSQFVSALLITLPQMKESSTLVLTGKKLVSTDYIQMTLNYLKKSGIQIKQSGVRKFFVKGNQKFKGLKNLIVPSDYGLAAFLMAAAALVPSKVTFEGYFDDRLIQADGRILDFLRKMGVAFKRSSGGIIMKGPFYLKGGNFSLKDCPDLVPIMAVLAMFADGTTRLKDIGHARAKESDRISDLRQELLKAGADIEEKSNELIIHPRQQYRKNVTFDPHRDHRLAMAFAVLGLKIGATIKDIECTHKSYPDFMKDLRSLTG